jgi:hypothetical protein
MWSNVNPDFPGGRIEPMPPMPPSPAGCARPGRRGPPEPFGPPKLKPFMGPPMDPEASER